jgi:hypothetical protein
MKVREASSSRLKKSLLVRCGTERSPGTGGTLADAPVAILAK